MPFEIIKLPKNKYKLINKITGKIHAKSTTLNKAKKQIQLMHMIDNKIISKHK